MNNKVYWNTDIDPDKWNDFGFMTFVLIPNKWWSISEWKLANSLRAEMLKRGLILLKPNPIGEKERK